MIAGGCGSRWTEVALYLSRVEQGAPSTFPASSNTHCLPPAFAHHAAPDFGRLWRALSRGRLAPCSVGPHSSHLQAPPTSAFLSPFVSRAQRPRVSLPSAKRVAIAPLPGLSRLKVPLNAPVERSSSPGNRGLASRPQVRAKLEGRSWWRLPSGLWHASIFLENRPGQSEVRANTRASGVAGGGWKGVLRGAAAPSSTRLPLPGGRKSKQEKTALDTQTGSIALRQKNNTPTAKQTGSLAPRQKNNTPTAKHAGSRHPSDTPNRLWKSTFLKGQKAGSLALRPPRRRRSPKKYL